MKFSLFILFAVVAVVFSAPSSDETEEIAIEVDNVAKISNYIDSLRIEKPRKKSDKIISSVFLNSLDQNCILANYQKNGIVDKIPTPRRFSFRRKSYPTTAEEVEEDLKPMIFFSIAVECSSKTDDILEFFFENLWTSKILLKAFINEPEMKDIKDMMTCANNYAVTNGIINPAVYQINFEVTDDFKDQCLEWVNASEKSIISYKKQVLRDSQRDCSRKIVDSSVNFAIKNVLLLQVDMTEEGKSLVKKSFLEEFHQIFEKITKCASGEANENFRMENEIE
jgi:hypothetical protein